MSKAKNILKLLVSSVIVLLLSSVFAHAGIGGFVKGVYNDAKDGAKDTYHGAKSGAKSIYKKGKGVGKYLVQAEVRGLKKIIRLEGKILKTEANLLTYLATKPVYIVTDFVSKKGQKPVRRPDLTITGMKLDKDCNVVVYITNKGPGIVTINPRSKVKTVDLFFKKDGKNWGGTTHKLFDPRKRLLFPGGKIRVVTKIKIKKATKITAIIDFQKSVIEVNERNNVISKVFDCKKPDLIIEKIYLDKNCRVRVAIKNIGKGKMSDDAWTNRRVKDTGVYLQLNGKKWGGSTFKGIDSRKRLSKPGGRAIFKSNLKVRNEAKITATVDHLNRITESKENNNKKSVKLVCNKTKELRPATSISPVQMQESNNNQHMQINPKQTTQMDSMSRKEMIPNKADLVVDKLYLNKNCNVVVRVKNIGNAGIPKNLYKKVQLNLSISGYNWGHINLSRYDKNKKLTKPGGYVVFVSKLNVQDAGEITATIDNNEVLNESNENNNQYVKTLTCKKQRSRR